MTTTKLILSRPISVVLGLFLFMAPETARSAAPGITADQILVGQTAPMSGPAAALGKGMAGGLTVAFAEVNGQGGVNGRKIQLVTRDDGYEPPRAATNATALINDDKAFLLIGCVGTPTSAQVVPICTANGVPFVGAFTGSGAFRATYNPLIVNFRASYGQEMERLVSLLVDAQGRRSIACFYQDDLYGQSGLKALQAALKRRGIEPSALGLYVRNSNNVDEAAATICKASPDAVVMVGTYAPCASFVKRCRSLGLTEAKFCTISFVGTKALVAALGPDAEGLIVSQVVPNPLYSQQAIAASYRKALASFAPGTDADWISFEGYIVGRLFIELAKKAGPDLTREGIVKAAQDAAALPIDDLTLAYGPGHNQGSDTVFLTQVKQGTIVSIH